MRALKYSEECTTYQILSLSYRTAFSVLESPREIKLIMPGPHSQRFWLNWFSEVLPRGTHTNR